MTCMLQTKAEFLEGSKSFLAPRTNKLLISFDFLLFIVIVINGEGIRLIKRFEDFEVEVKF